MNQHSQVEVDAIPGVTSQPCQCHGSVWVPTAKDCICPPTERFIRAYSHDENGELPALTPEQRAWMLDQIGRVEGYTRAEHENDSDKWLAVAVLSAWRDFARDKGIY
jgi:hypothetical protein